MIEQPDHRLEPPDLAQGLSGLDVFGLARASAETEDPDRLVSIIHFMRYLGDDRAVPALGRLLRHPSNRVRNQASSAVASIGSGSDQAGPWISEALGGEDDEDIATGLVHTAYWVYAVSAWKNIAGRLISSESVKMRRQAAETLGRLHKGRTELLSAAQVERHPAVQREIRSALYQIAHPSPWPDLWKAEFDLLPDADSLGSPTWLITHRSGLTTRLAEDHVVIGPDNRAPLTFSRTAGHAHPLLQQLAEEPDRPRAVFWRFGQAAPEIIVSALRDATEESALRVILGLLVHSQFDEPEPPGELLIPYFRHASPLVRAEAIKYALMMGLDPPVPDELLSCAKTERDPAVRPLLMTALRRYSPLAIPSLIEALGDSHGPTRFCAAESLGAMGGVEVIEPLRNALAVETWAPAAQWMRAAIWRLNHPA